jgi:hypothetical protein
MKRFRNLGIALSAGLVLSLALASAGSAFSTLKLTGHHGDFGTKPATADGPTMPGARCGYGAPDKTGTAHLAWVKVFPFDAAAYNRTKANDQQSVKFQLTVQRSINGGTSWASVGSTSETRTASETMSAAFDTLKVATHGKRNQLFRAIVTLTWLHNGTADGLAKVRMEYYSVKWAPTVGDPSFVYQDACDGAAD